MQRREFITILGGTAAVWPIGTSAQQTSALRRIGLFSAGSEDDPIGRKRIDAFLAFFEALDWNRDRNVHVEYRWGGGDPTRIGVYAQELADLRLEVILALTTPVVAALKSATRTTPIVFAIVADPVAQGLVSNSAHPSDNITGFSFVDYPLVGKSAELVKTIAPDLRRVGFMFNPNSNPYYERYLDSFRGASRTLAVEMIPARVRSETEIERSIGGLAGDVGSGLVVLPDPFTTEHREAIIKMCEQMRLPAIASFRDYVARGGLMSYGASDIDIMRQSASYVDRIFSRHLWIIADQSWKAKGALVQRLGSLLGNSEKPPLQNFLPCDRVDVNLPRLCRILNKNFPYRASAHLLQPGVERTASDRLLS